jgi:two-component system sensor histidine kinase HydH
MVAGKKRTEVLSWTAAAGAVILLTGLGLFILKGQLYTNALLARNDGERTLNLLLSTLRAERKSSENETGKPPEERFAFDPVREMQESSRIVQDHPTLGEKILGLGAYSSEGAALFRYGSAPEYQGRVSLEEPDGGVPPRSYEFDGSSRSLRIVHPAMDFRILRRARKDGTEEDESPRGLKILYFEIRQDAYWLKNRIAYAVFISWEILLVLGSLLVRDTLMKNIAYRRKIQDQRQLVALGSAARTLAHEIKNPLSAIRLQADVIARLCPSLVRGELEGINQEVKRLGLLVDRIGDFLREPRGTPEKLDLLDFVRDTAGRLAPNIPPVMDDVGEGGGAGTGDGGPVFVSMDPERLRSVVENLVRNALESGSPPASIWITVSASADGAVFEILDRGEGLPDVDVELLFDPFFTTKRKGSGIGLSISRRFVEAAGGKLLIKNREGGGAVVRVILPEYAP